MGRVDVRAVLGPLAVLAVWAVAWGAFQLSRGGSAQLQSTVAIAAAFDFVVTAALVLYVIALRPTGRAANAPPASADSFAPKRSSPPATRSGLPRWVLGPTLAAGFVFARTALRATPDGGHVIMVAFLGVELAMLSLLVIRGRRARRAWHEARDGGADGFEALTSAFVAARFPPRLAAIVATEFSLLAAAVTGWRRPVRSASLFTVHRVNGWQLYAGVLMFLIAVESVAVHIALVAWVSPLVAWIATASSLYSLLWLLGDVHALRHGGATIGDRDLELVLGVRWRGRLPWSAVTSIEPVTETPPDAVNASILGANVVVRLRSPVRLHGVFGRVREGAAIALSIDDREAFVAAARAAMLRA